MRSTTNFNKKTHSNIYFPLQDYPWGDQVPLPSRSGVRVHRTWSAGRREYEGVEGLLQVNRRRTRPGEACFHYLGALHELSVSRPSRPSTAHNWHSSRRTMVSTPTRPPRALAGHLRQGTQFESKPHLWVYLCGKTIDTTDDR